MSQLFNKSLIAALFLGTTSFANAALINSYDFDGDYSDTLGNGVDLVANGGSINSGRYEFSNNQSLILNSAFADTTSYAVEMSITFDSKGSSTSNYSKLIDFDELILDSGLYLYREGITFYPEDETVGEWTIGREFTVGMERTDTAIKLYLNGSMIYSLDDEDSLLDSIPSNNILNFFADDTDTSQRESFEGSVDWIRIHDDASTFSTPPTQVPEPTLLGLLGLALMGLTRKRIKTA